MPLVISCPSCSQKLSFKDEHAGKKSKCPGCGTILSIPLAKAVPISRAIPVSASPMTPALIEEEKPSFDPSPAVAVKKKKKSKARGSSKAKVHFTMMGVRMTTPLLLLFSGLLVGFLSILTLVIVFVPFGAIFSSKPDVEFVDVYTAINGMRYHDIGERVMQSKSTAYCVPGWRKILVTRPSPEGEFLLVNVKVPYKDVEAAFPGARGPATMTRGLIQIEANGERTDCIFIQPENDHTRGFFQLDYSPPKQEGSTAKLTDYLGPKERDWTHEGEKIDIGEGFEYKGSRGMKVLIQVGAQRQDGPGGGNLVNDLTGKKIFRDQDYLVPAPEGYIHVTWNQGSQGWICAWELEQPNEIGLNWHMTCIFPKPKNMDKQTKLIVFGKEKKLRLPG